MSRGLTALLAAGFILAVGAQALFVPGHVAQTRAEKLLLILGVAACGALIWDWWSRRGERPYDHQRDGL